MKILKTPSRFHMITAVLMAFASSSFTLTAENADTKNAAENNSTTVEKMENGQQEQATGKRKEIIEEARTTIRETENALVALDKEDTKAALQALERASGKLKIALAREPELALAPVSVAASTQDILANVETVKVFVMEAEDALKDGRVQDARRILGVLGSEKVISVTHLPLASYPAAITEAVALLEKGETKSAKSVLQTALNSQVVLNYTIPLAVVRAKNLLLATDDLSKKEDRSESENEKLADLLNKSRTELEFAEALGYGTQRDFQDIYEQIDLIEKKTEKGKSGSGFLGKIKKQIKGVLESNQPEKK